MLTAFAIAMALQNPSPPVEVPLQVLKSPAFDQLLRDVDAQCPRSQLRYASPAALLDTEDSFAEKLARRDFVRLRGATPPAPPGGDPCAGRGGASCPATVTLIGLERTGLEARFTRFVCARGDRPWG